MDTTVPFSIKLANTTDALPLSAVSFVNKTYLSLLIPAHLCPDLAPTAGDCLKINLLVLGVTLVPLTENDCVISDPEPDKLKQIKPIAFVADGFATDGACKPVIECLKNEELLELTVDFVPTDIVVPLTVKTFAACSEADS